MKKSLLKVTFAHLFLQVCVGFAEWMCLSWMTATGSSCWMKAGHSATKSSARYISTWRTAYQQKNNSLLLLTIIAREQIIGHQLSQEQLTDSCLLLKPTARQQLSQEQLTNSCLLLTITTRQQNIRQQLSQEQLTDSCLLLKFTAREQIIGHQLSQEQLTDSCLLLKPTARQQLSQEQLTNSCLLLTITARQQNIRQLSQEQLNNSCLLLTSSCQRAGNWTTAFSRAAYRQLCIQQIIRQQLSKSSLPTAVYY